MVLRGLCFSLFLILGGCAAPRLSSEETKVTKIENVPSDCIEIGEVSARDTVWGKFSYAETNLKNEVAKAGGNAYVIQSVERIQQVPINAKAYKCKNLP